MKTGFLVVWYSIYIPVAFVFAFVFAFGYVTKYANYMGYSGIYIGLFRFSLIVFWVEIINHYIRFLHGLKEKMEEEK